MKSTIAKGRAAEPPKINVCVVEHDAELATEVDHAIVRTAQWFVDRQHADGYWCGELEGDTILESEYILLLAWLGRERTDAALSAARYIKSKQSADGGWALYPGGKLDISVSVKAYFALKLTGHDTDDDYMRRARRAIREHGGADAVNSFTRFYLALLGQIPYRHCPAVPPEMVLLPNWSPINIYRVSAWSRTIFVPLAIMWAHQPVRELRADQGIHELFLESPEHWPRLRRPGASKDPGLFSWDRFFRTVDTSLKFCERHSIRPFRARALRSAESWMLSRFADSDGLGAIFPPIVWSVVALKCLGYREDSPEFTYCIRQLEALMIEDHDTTRLQPCKSPVWDTALALRGLSASSAAGPAVTNRAIAWLLDKEVRTPGDWSVNVDAEPAGWYFEHRNAFYPDIDDTIMVMMALRESLELAETSGGGARRASAARSACDRAARWVLAMQNRDGGWGAFDKDNDQEFLCHVPFADHNAMIDPSTPDITARVLEALAPFGYSKDDAPIRNAVRYLRGTQETDGSWFGRWGVNHIYGTWQVLVGLAAVGIAEEDPAIRRGAQWLLDCQQACGGWGESADSYSDPGVRGKGKVTASQTAWALLGLIAAGRGGSQAVERGVRYLVQSQQQDGAWAETEFTGTGFPRVFYLRYHMYPVYFPLLVLGQWKRATAVCSP